MARPSVIGAFFAGILGFGYVYVGRIAFALALVAISIALFFIASWTRWIMDPQLLYGLAGVLIMVALLGIIHPMVIASRYGDAPRKAYNRWWFYVIWLVIVGLGSEVLFGNRGAIFGYEAFRIPSASMSPTLQLGDVVMVDSWRYRDAEPELGDVVAYVSDESTGTIHAKRVVGLPGDRVEIVAGDLFRNGERVSEPYLNASTESERLSRVYFPNLAIALGREQYFVLGDNRGYSLDSRHHGPVQFSQIVGRVEFIWFSTAGLERFSLRVADGT